MLLDRYKYLMNTKASVLTENEIKVGWHFCNDWDGLLIDPNMKEIECCACNIEGITSIDN